MGLKCWLLAPWLSSDLCEQLPNSGGQREWGGHHGCGGGVALSLASPQGQYRTVLYDSWVKKLTEHQVPHTSEPTLIGTLGNPVKIRSWQVPSPGDGATGPGVRHRPGWAGSLLPPSHPLSWVCLLNPLGAS